MKLDVIAQFDAFGRTVQHEEETYNADNASYFLLAHDARWMDTNHGVRKDAKGRRGLFASAANSGGRSKRGIWIQMHPLRSVGEVGGFCYHLSEGHRLGIIPRSTPHGSPLAAKLTAARADEGGIRTTSIHLSDNAVSALNHHFFAC